MVLFKAKTWFALSLYFWNFRFIPPLFLYCFEIVLVQPFQRWILFFTPKQSILKMIQHFTTEWIARLQLLVRFVPSEDQLADILTKLMSSRPFCKFKNQTFRSASVGYLSCISTIIVDCFFSSTWLTQTKALILIFCHCSSSSSRSAQYDFYYCYFISFSLPIKRSGQH